MKSQKYQAAQLWKSYHKHIHNMLVLHIDQSDQGMVMQRVYATINDIMIDQSISLDQGVVNVYRITRCLVDEYLGEHGAFPALTTDSFKELTAYLIPFAKGLSKDDLHTMILEYYNEVERLSLSKKLSILIGTVQSKSSAWLQLLSDTLSSQNEQFQGVK